MPSESVVSVEKPAAVHEEQVDFVSVDESEDLGPWQTIWQNPKIVAISFFANIGALMYGFDNLALSICLSMVPFQQQFGEPVMTTTGPGYLIPAYWQSLWNALGQVGTMLGALSVSVVSDRFGRKVAFLIAGLISFAGVAVVYIAASPGVFLAGKMINAFALGMALANGQTYVSEISPLKARGILLSLFTFCMNLGYLMAASIAFSRVEIMSDSAYKVLFAIGWCWPALLVTVVWLIPESPPYLIRKQNVDGAEKSLRRLRNNKTNIPLLLHQAIKIDTEEKKNSERENDVTYIECFRGTNWRRTRIILYANGLSQMIGATFLANAPYFLILAGMSPTNTAMMIELGIGFGMISSFITFFCLARYSRRSILLSGVALAAVLFLPMGISGCFQNSTALWVTGITLQLVWFTLGPAIGPSTAIAGEVSEVRLRSKSQSIGFMFNYFFSTVWNVVVPYMFNSDQGNLGGKMGFIFLATSLISLVILFYEMPETKDKTYSELDILFKNKVPSRKFKTAIAEEPTV